MALPALVLALGPPLSVAAETTSYMHQKYRSMIQCLAGALRFAVLLNRASRGLLLKAVGKATRTELLTALGPISMKIGSECSNSKMIEREKELARAKRELLLRTSEATANNQGVGKPAFKIAAVTKDGQAPAAVRCCSF